MDRKDAFIDWVERNEEVHVKLNEMFREMRASSVYSFKRQSMKLQYEILALGLKSDMQQGGEPKNKLN